MLQTVVELENALGAALLRARLAGAAPPRLADRYVVRRFLGRGATGLVVAAQDERLGREVALKLTLCGADDHALHEARALARIDHPNVVPVLDAEQIDAVVGGAPVCLQVVVMQLVPGRTLRTWLLEEPRTTQAILDVYRGAGRGLVAVHAQRIVHRDFKPDNVIVTPDGTPKLVDFAFAAPDLTSQVAARAAAGEVAGTDRYLAPEARLGRATASSDQYAFCVALMEALGVTEQAIDASPPAGIDPHVWSLLRRGSSAQAQDRFPSMQHLLDDLERARAVRVPWRRVGVAAVLTLAVIMAFALSRPSGAPQPARSADTTPADPCSALPTKWAFRARTTEENEVPRAQPSEGAIYEVRITERVDCHLSLAIERLCDRGNGFKLYRSELFLGQWQGDAHPLEQGNVDVPITDTQIRGNTFDFALVLDAQGRPGGTFEERETPDASSSVVRSGTLEPASRSDCDGGRVGEAPR